MRSTLPALLIWIGCLLGPTWGQSDFRLREAIEQENGSTIAKILRAQPKLASQPVATTKLTPLAYAFQSNRPAAVRTLLSLGATMGKDEPLQQSALHAAIRSGNPELVELVLRHDLPVDQPDRNQSTPLMLIATYRQQPASLVSQLIKAGADPAAVNRAGQTPLHLACFYNRPEVARALLKFDPPLNVADRSQNTPLLAACMSCPGMVAELIDAGAAVEVVNRQQRTALHLAAEQGHASTIELLVDQFPEVDLLDSLQQTPLQLAVFRNHVTVAQRLLDAGANPNAGGASDSVFRSMLGQAATSGSMKLTQCLVQAGADINATDGSGRTPVHLLIEAAGQATFSPDRNRPSPGRNRDPQGGQFEDVLVYLIDQQADLKVANEAGLTPTQMAVARDLGSFVERIVIATGQVDFQVRDSTPLHWAAQRGLARTSRLAIQDHPSWRDATDADGRTPLHLAASGNHTAVVRLLLDAGAKVDARDPSGTTPLLVAATAGQPAALQILLDRGAAINHRDAGGQHALHLAAWSGSSFCVDTLLEREVDPNVATSSGYTALHAAAWNADAEVARTLIRAQADIDAADSDGWTPLHKAAHQGHGDLVRLLLAAGANRQAQTALGMTPAELVPADQPELSQLLQ